MGNISFGLAFLAGIFSFLSPCVLPLVPGYVSFLSGISLEDLRKGKKDGKLTQKAVLASLFFVAGFSLVFISFGASASFIGKLFSQHTILLTRIAGIIIVVFGLHLLGIFRIKWLNYEKRLHVKQSSPGFFGAFIIGIAFAFGWAPCVGPILAGILAMAAVQATLLRGVMLLAAYSLGLGVPFIITGFAVGAFMRFFEKYKPLIRWGEIAAGLLLVCIGCLIFVGNLSILTKYIPSVLYEFAK